MTAEELLDWALKNIHSSEWRFLMIAKVAEEKVKQLTKDQVVAIQLFVMLLDKNKYYTGDPDGVIRMNTVREVLKFIEKTSETKSSSPKAS